MLTVANRHTATPEQLKKAIYIGRPSALENPFVMGKDGDRDEVVRKFTHHFTRALMRRVPEIENAFRALRPTDILMCFCDPKPCHGHVIRDLYERLCCSGRDYEVALQALIDETASKATAMEVTPPKNKVFTPATDGIDHINIYSRGKTPLGKMLSNFAHTPFTHRRYGAFASIEAFWYWVSIGEAGRYHHQVEAEVLKTFYGFKAKDYGRRLREKAFNETKAYLLKSQDEQWTSEQCIKEAMLAKIEQNKPLAEMLRTSTLPLTHYYAWGDDPKNQKISYQDKFAWLTEYWEDLREYLNGRARKLIIAGSRKFTEDPDYEELKSAISKTGLKVIEVVSGRAKGADSLGERWAIENNIPVQPFPADWETHKKAAGHLRNAQMAKYGTAAVLLWDGHSPGTKGMQELMRRSGKPYYTTILE